MSSPYHLSAPQTVGEICQVCGADASHKVSEEVLMSDGDEKELGYYVRTAQSKPWTHNLTAYLCCKHFGEVMGRLAQSRCKIAVDLANQATTSEDKP